MNSFRYKSFLFWGMVFLFIEVVLIFLYFNFSDKEMKARDQLAQIFTARSENPAGFPTLKQNMGGFALSADSFISVFVSDSGAEKILAEKNKDAQLPIASISKLMTALIAGERYKLDDIVTITDNSLKVDSLSGIYKAGDRFFFYNALRAMLIASQNEIADALTYPACPSEATSQRGDPCREAGQPGGTEFIGLMNKKASELGLLNTGFVNTTGLDPVPADGSINHSTVFDIYKLARYIEENNSDIFYITAQKEFDLFDVDKKFIGTIKNTDKLLSEQGVPFIIIGGKTGETDIAKQNLVIVAEAPCGGKIFSVVLGSQNRFDDMKKILQYINDSYDWPCPNL